MPSGGAHCLPVEDEAPDRGSGGFLLYERAELSCDSAGPVFVGGGLVGERAGILGQTMRAGQGKVRSRQLPRPINGLGH